MPGALRWTRRLPFWIRPLPFLASWIHPLRRSSSTIPSWSVAVLTRSLASVPYWWNP